MRRLFVAVKVKAGMNFIEIYDRLRTQLSQDRITWVNESKIHLTLKFFGDTPEAEIDPICNLLDEVAGRHRPSTAEMEQVGIFGSSYNPRVIWFGLHNTEPLTDLAEDMLDSLDRIGYERDRQNFRPHITIGRIKSISNKKYFQSVIDQYNDTYIQPVPVEEFHLIESTLTPQGPVYETLETFML